MANQTSTSQRKILNISLPPQLYYEVERVAKEEAKTKAELARELLRNYLRVKKEWKDIFKWGEAAAKRLGIKNEDDVERIVDEVRRGK